MRRILRKIAEDEYGNFGDTLTLADWPWSATSSTIARTERAAGLSLPDFGRVGGVCFKRAKACGTNPTPALPERQREKVWHGGYTPRLFCESRPQGDYSAADFWYCARGEYCIGVIQ
jgi:hypothetical protein